MQIIFEQTFASSLLSIIRYIAKDKKSAAIDFKKELQKKILLLETSPLMCQQSIYFESDGYRDLTFKGYTVIYKIENNLIKILDIFKWQNFN